MGRGQAILSHLCILAAPPSTLNLSAAHRKRKTLVAPEINISLDQSEGSLLSDDFLDTPDDLDINVDDIETPDETDSLEFLGNGNDLEWEGTVSVLPFSPLAPLCPFWSQWPQHYDSGRCLRTTMSGPCICVETLLSHGFSQRIKVQMNPTQGVTGGRRLEGTTHP